MRSQQIIEQQKLDWYLLRGAGDGVAVGRCGCRLSLGSLPLTRKNGLINARTAREAARICALSGATAAFTCRTGVAEDCYQSSVTIERE